MRDTRTRRATALALVALLVGAVVPWDVAAQTGDYSGSASGTVADARLPAPGGGAPVHATWGESTGAVNSRAEIVPDHPSTAEDESQDLAVGTATGVRVTGPMGRVNPGSVQSGAPGDAEGSFSMDGPDPDSLVSEGSVSTQSAAAPDGSTASTANSTSLTESQLVFHLPLEIPTGSSQATVTRSADGRVSTTGEARLAGEADSPISAFGGYVTAAGIGARSRSTANGTSSAQTVDFDVSDLRLNNVPDGAALITADARPGAGNAMLVDVTIAVPGGASASETITLPRGSNLLASSSYLGTTLAPAFVALSPFLGPLTAPMGPLQDLSIVLGAGFSDAGDESYARGLIEAVRLSIVVGTATVAHTLGRAYSAADAARAFSTATDPALPSGTLPATAAALAFPESRTASPTQLAFASARPVAGQPGEPRTAPGSPAEPGGEPLPGGAPLSDSPAEPGGEPVADEPGEPAKQPGSRAQAPPAAGVVLADAGAVFASARSAALPSTGLDALTVAFLGAALMLLGWLVSSALAGTTGQRR